MFGWINDCTEKLVLSKFGEDKWHEIKEKAGCKVDDGGFVRHQIYPDDSTVSLVVAASDVLGIPVDGILEAFGQYFMEFTRQNGYENLLRCQGSTLRLWLSNLNALHDHLESSLPNGFIPPVFWCEDDETVKGSILLHYYSRRGSLLVPVVVGVVKEVARFHFEIDIEMDRLSMQGDDNRAEFTSWRISASDSSQQWKLTQEEESSHLWQRNVNGSLEATAESLEATSMPSSSSMKCPFSGMSSLPTQGLPSQTLGFQEEKKRERDSSPQPSETGLETCSLSKEERPPISITGDKMREVFPYHVVVNADFVILQVGSKLPRLIHETESSMLNREVGDFLQITRPLLSRWDWPTLHKLQDQTFFLDPILHNGCKAKTAALKGNIMRLSDLPLTVMFVLSPDAKNVSELKNMGLTMSDLPLHSFQRDAVFLGEHISSEVRSAHQLDKLSKRLANEKKLSNELLYSLLPRKVADELRDGKAVEPEHFQNVTLFFSDIVGFTTICDVVTSWDVIDMLNELYSMMDCIAKKFNCHKVETIGDAYICACGVPIPDDKHAENIANFAIAVQACMGHILSPVDGTPLQLRIGIHSGSLMGGVVGHLTPRYCLFGDTVNVTARHESTGEADRIQCSSVTYGLLKHFSGFEEDQYNFVPRGLVQMKGKGELFTYWLLGGTKKNERASQAAIARIYELVGKIMEKNGHKKKRTYFTKKSTRRGSELTIFDSDSVLSLDAESGFTLESDLDDPLY